MAEFKKGDKVRLVDNPRSQWNHRERPEYYPEPGTVGTVYQTDPSMEMVRVKWPDETVMGPTYVWWLPAKLLELVKNAAPDYYIRVTATSEHGAQVEVNGPADWVHEALARAIMGLNSEDSISVLASVIARALSAEEGEDDE